MASPFAIYRHNIEVNNFSEDAGQAIAIKALNALYLQIDNNETVALNSLYLWGKVGRGKTYLMDCFYESVSDKAQRMHYYRFMQHVHDRLTQYQGHKDPLEFVAKDLLKTYKILCLDEFFVSDIADAMLLGRLMKFLFQQGMILVTTSNVEPQHLYKDGLQRDRFIPAIKMLEAHLTVINMDGIVDHRLTKANGFPHYAVQLECYSNDDIVTKSAVYQSFVESASRENIEFNIPLLIESREIQCIAKSDEAYVFSFEQLFLGPRSANDYIALCRIAKRIYIINIPQMGGQLSERKVARGTEDTHNINHRVANRPFILAKGDDEARRFISFIDEAYDQRVSVIISAQAPLNDLYLGGRVTFEFERAYSRIIEMQSMNFGS